jgi:DNA (cytosine-5)-methyltransferase 1
MKPFIYNMEYVMKQSSKNLFNVVSLFAGSGGSSTGYRLAGGNVLAINEFVESARDTYKANYPNTHIFDGDIRSLSGQDILEKIGLNRGELDILDGSPPCSSFSIAGKKQELWGEVKKYSDTEQRTDDLFFEFARIVNEIQPKMFIAENVKGLTQGSSASLLGSEQINMFGEVQEKTIYDELSMCGYNVRYKVLNAKDFMVPQNRERLFIVGVRKDIRSNFVYPKQVSGFVSLGEALNDVMCIEMNRKAFGEEEPRRVSRGDVCFTVTADGLGATRRYKVVRHGLNVAQKDRGDSTKDFVESNTTVSPTILSKYKGLANGLVEVEYEDGDIAIRRLSIPELKIICSFPKDYILTGSYSKQWERLGRAVPPLMMYQIAKSAYNSVLCRYDTA